MRRGFLDCPLKPRVLLLGNLGKRSGVPAFDEFPFETRQSPKVSSSAESTHFRNLLKMSPCPPPPRFLEEMGQLVGYGVHLLEAALDPL